MSADYAMSNWLEEKLLAYVFQNGAVFKTAEVYVGIFDANATAAEIEANTQTNEITEYTGNRPAVTFVGDGAMDAPAQNLDGEAEIRSEAVLTFSDMPLKTGDDQKIRYVAVFNAPTAGEVLMFKRLTADKYFNEGDITTIPIGDLVLQAD